MTQQTRRACLVALALVGTLHLACTPGGVPQTQQSPAPKAQIVEPIGYPGGVYYFGATGESYLRSLGAFEEAHPELSCSYRGAVESNTLNVVAIQGHALRCRNSAVYAQDKTVP